MTDQPAAIQACFSDFRLVKGRKVCQLVLEIPLEQADSALSTLGGIPQPATERWVAVARLGNGGPVYEGMLREEFNDIMQGKPKPDKEKQKWEDVKLSMQAGRRCNEKSFQKFMVAGDSEQCAQRVRAFCKVDSRRGLNDNPEAADRWRDLERSYHAWLKAAE